MDDRGVSGCVFFGVFFDASLMLPWSALDACPACGQRPGFGPAADRLSCRAARKSAKKRAQMPATPALRSGATCVVAVAGVAAGLAAVPAWTPLRQTPRGR